MRLIAIPLARATKSSAPVATFLAQKSPKSIPKVQTSASQISKTSQDNTSTSKNDAPASTSTSSADENSIFNTKSSIPLSNRVMQKASDFWIGLGKPDQKSFLDWKRRTYNTGEKLMDRIEYEEWALKAVDPALGPDLLHPNQQGEDKQDQKKDDQKEAKIGSGKLIGKSPGHDVPLLFPPSLMSPTPLLASLKTLTASRSPHHRRRMWWCIIGAPLTAPFMLVPVIPNLPFFYLVWRAWSHWKAFKSSAYLSALIEQNRLIPTASPELDKVFSTPEPNPIPKRTATNASPSESLKPNSSPSEASPSTSTPKVKNASAEAESILKDYHVPLLIKAFSLDTQMGTELNRALMQTQNSIKDGKFEKIERAAEHGSASREDEKKKKEE